MVYDLTLDRRSWVFGAAVWTSALFIRASNAAPSFPALRSLASTKGLIFGGATNTREIDHDPEFASFFGQQCGMLFPTGEFQWGNLQKQRNDPYDFKNGDRLVAFAQSQAMTIHGHALLYYRATPKWLEEEERDGRILIENHIQTVASHYRGKLHSWDVVNETIDPQSPRQDGLRETTLLKKFGPDFIERAFHLAAEYDPHSIRMFSEAALECRGERYEKLRQLVLETLNRLIRQRVPVQAIAIHGHLNASFDGEAFETFLKDCSSLGLKIMLTELDVIDAKLPSDVHQRDIAAAKMTQEFLDVVLANHNTIGLTCFGLSDRYTWVKTYAPRQDGLPVRPLPFDTDFNPKPMAFTIADAIRRAPTRGVKKSP